MTHDDSTATAAPPADEDRVLAALSHAGIILNGFSLLGMIGAALIWATQRQRSRFVAGHALQALVFQGVGLILTLLLAGIWACCLLVSLFPALLRPALYREEPPLSFWLALLGGLVIAAFALSGVVYGLLGAWAAWRGQTFRYVLVGSLIDRRQPEPPSAEPLAPPAELPPVPAVPQAGPDENGE